MLIRKETVFSPKLPMGSYFYKETNGKKIYKNRYINEYYITYPSGDRHVVEQHSGECHC
ncbi:MAG: hypothetical protein Q8M94_11615 [Ignavibacteria bacterium]|nr:hypothetical protein [Ignavibacteria bacterium]